MKQFTFIVAYKHGPQRLNNLKRVLNWINMFNGVEVIIIEQDRTSKLEDIDLKCRYYFIESELPFNKAWAFNVGLKYATTDKIVFGDCDLIMQPEDFVDGLNHLSSFECVSPYSKIGVIDLERSELGYNFEQLKKITRPGRGELEDDIRKVPLCGGIIMFQKDALLKIGGWDESFIGWGGEDDFQSIKVQRLLKWKELNHKVYHLWHPPTQPDMNYYQRNLKILNEVPKMDDNQFMAYIAKSRLKIGLSNKYS